MKKILGILLFVHASSAWAFTTVKCVTENVTAIFDESSRRVTYYSNSSGHQNGSAQTVKTYQIIFASGTETTDQYKILNSDGSGLHVTLAKHGKSGSGEFRYVDSSTAPVPFLFCERK